MMYINDGNTSADQLTVNQIWHSFIILAIILHYRAIFVAHAVRYEYSCRAVDSGRAVSEVVEDIWKTVFGGY